MLAFSAVYGCVNVISSDIAKLPIIIEREDDDGSRTEIPRHPASILFHRPNHYQTNLDFIQSIMSAVLLAGNSYALLERDQREVVSAMHPLNPAHVMPLVNDQTGDVFYQLTLSPATPLLGPLTKESLSENLWVVPARAMFHHRVMTVDHPLIGVTPLYAAAASASIGIHASGGSGDYLSRMARPSGVLQSPGKIEPALAEKLKSDWQKNYSGMNQGMPAVLGGGLEWKPLTVSAVDMQLIELLRWSVEDVARVYRVPPFALGELGKASYKNSEQMMRAYYSGCLSYHIISLEQRFDRTLDLASDVYCEFDLDEMLRTEMDVRYAAYEKGIGAGWLAPNEVRRKEGYKKAKGGDEPFLQMQNIPLSIAAEGPTPKAEPVPVKPGDAEPPDDPPDEEGAGGDEKAGVALDLTRALSGPPAPDLPPLLGHAGVWSDAEFYPVGVAVTHDGSTWIAKADSTGIKPGVDNVAWRLIVKRGMDGKAGRGFNWRGLWATGTKYHRGDVVRAWGAVWIATRATDAEPPAATDEGEGWSLMMKGAA
jgi:HK97 family phage portal protein